MCGEGGGREEGGDRGCVGRGEGERRVVIEDKYLEEERV